MRLIYTGYQETLLHDQDARRGTHAIRQIRDKVLDFDFAHFDFAV